MPLLIFLTPDRFLHWRRCDYPSLDCFAIYFWKNPFRSRKHRSRIYWILELKVLTLRIKECIRDPIDDETPFTVIRATLNLNIPQRFTQFLLEFLMSL